jgi:uncharacterized membrane protein YphA (DoxX/SURF4 family)
MKHERYRAFLGHLVHTQDGYWIIAFRLVVGVVLLSPLGGNTPYALPYCGAVLAFAALPVDFGCRTLRLVEAVAGVLLVSGTLTRPTCVLAIPFLLLRGIDILAVTAPVNTDLPSDAPTWIDGVTYLAGVMVLLDLLVVGGGEWSVDNWIWKKILLHRGDC